jgi:hypothetical protein
VVVVQEIAKDMMEQQTPKQIHIIRGKLYELLVNCLPPEIIIRKLSMELMSKLDDELKYKCSAAAAQFEHRLQVDCYLHKCNSEAERHLSLVAVKHRRRRSFEGIARSAHLSMHIHSRVACCH